VINTFNGFGLTTSPIKQKKRQKTCYLSETMLKPHFLFFVQCIIVCVTSLPKPSSPVAEGGGDIPEPPGYLFYGMFSEVEETNPFDNVDEDTISLKNIFFPVLSAAITSIYGISLVLFSNYCYEQIRCLSMIRATGHLKMEEAIKVWKQKYRDAKFAAVRRAPSFYLASRSLRRLDQRLAYHQKLRIETKKALEDGVVVRREARKLKSMHRKEIRAIRRDMRRLARATLNIGRIFQLIQINELIDIGKSILFQILVVLMSSNYSHGHVGSLISKWCIFLNLGSLMLDTERKLDYFVGKLILKYSRYVPIIEESIALEIICRIFFYGVSAYFILSMKNLAMRINAAFLSAAIVIRGLRSLTTTIYTWYDDDDESNILPTLKRFFDGTTGGVLMLLLATTSLVTAYLVQKHKMIIPIPESLAYHLNLLEKGISNFAVTCTENV